MYMYLYRTTLCMYELTCTYFGTIYYYVIMVISRYYIVLCNIVILHVF